MGRTMRNPKNVSYLVALLERTRCVLHVQANTPHYVEILMEGALHNVAEFIPRVELETQAGQ